jgi:hypothetical protein
MKKNMLPKYRAPTSPGEMLLEEFLKPMEMTQTELARKMGVPIQRVNTLINGKRGVTAPDPRADQPSGPRARSALFNGFFMRAVPSSLLVPSASAR